MNLRKKFLAACLLGTAVAGFATSAEAQITTTTNRLKLVNGSNSLLLLPPASGGLDTLSFPLMESGSEFVLTRPTSPQTITGGITINGGLTLGTALTVANGGTGATTHTQNGIMVGAGTGPLTTTANTTASTTKFLTQAADVGGVPQPAVWTDGSGNFIVNGTSQQASSNFNISGNGTIGGAATVTGALNANGTTNLNAAVNIGDGGADAVIVNTTGDFTVASDDFTVGLTGNVATDGTLTVTGASNLNGTAILNDNVDANLTTITESSIARSVAGSFAINPGAGSAVTTDGGIIATGTGGTAGLVDGVHIANSSVELVDNGGTPYVDFTTVTASDFDARLRLTDANTLALEGAALWMNGSAIGGASQVTSPLVYGGTDAASTLTLAGSGNGPAGDAVIINANATQVASFANAGITLNKPVTSAGAGNALGTAATDATVLTINGAIGTANELVVNGDANITGTLTAGALGMTGDLDMNTHNIIDLGDVTFNGVGDVITNTNSAVQIADDLNVTGATTLGAAAVNTVTVNGNATFNGTAAHGTNQVSGSNFVITGGSIDNTPIGGTTAADGKFTTLSSSGLATLANASVTGTTTTGKLAGTFSGRHTITNSTTQTISCAAVSSTSSITLTYVDLTGPVDDVQQMMVGTITDNTSFQVLIPEARVGDVIMYTVIN